MDAHGEARDEDTTPAAEHRQDAEGDRPDISTWAAAATKETCPSCGASGALRLGGGLFCPACGQTSLNPGYTASPEPDRPA